MARWSPTVFLGFTGLLLMMGALVVDSGRQLHDAAVNSSLLRKEYRERDALLDELRTNIHNVSTILRDHLLSPRETTDLKMIAELQDVRTRNEEILARYSARVSPAQRTNFQALRSRAGQYLDALLTAVGSSDARSLPQRGDLIRLASEISSLNQNDMNAGEERIEQLQARFEQRVASVSLAALVMSGILAVFVILRQQHLEREASKHLDQVRRLSNQLVTAHEEERRRISRELHDDIGQSMSAMLMDLGRLESRLVADDCCREILASVRRAAGENVARVRDMSLLLRPSMLDELGLVPALEWQVREVSRRHGLKVKMMSGDFDDDLPDAHRTCVYRIVQEALHNCVKHSHATEVRVALHRDHDSLVVSISDNGTGFDPKRQRGLGVLGMEERARRLGGAFSVESQPGGGTVVSLSLPLAPVNAGVLEGVV